MRRIVRLLAPLMVAGMIGLTACSDDDPPTGGGNNNPPPAATNVVATADGTDITVTWTAPSGLTGQRVELAATGEALRTQNVDAAATTATFTGLTDATTYTATVVTINANGETDSNTAQATIGGGTPAFEEITGDITADMTLTNDRKWLITGPVFVGEDCGPDPGAPLGGCTAVTLTIEPGTTILGNADIPQGERGSYLVVSRGSQIIADANRSLVDKGARPNPDSVIVFTSSEPRGMRARGDWGGLVLNGRAPINPGAEAQGEGESGLFGGVDDEDSSGILRGVRVEFAGDDVTATDQLNGIAFQGTGAGTTVDYVQVHYNVDDGTEPFGGSTTQTHMVMTGIGDDSFDGTDGYRGFIQFAIAQQRADDADRGLELSNNGDDGGATPKTTAVIANATLIGARTGEINPGGMGGGSSIGVNLREGSAWRVYNSIITNFGTSGLCVEGATAIANADARIGGETTPGEFTTIESSVLWANATDGGGVENFADACGSGYDNQTFWEDAAFNNLTVDPGLPASAFNLGTQGSPPDVVPAAVPGGYVPFDVSTLNDEGGAGIVMPTDGRTLQATDYPGAVEPGTAAASAWYAGWTVWDPTGADSRGNVDDQ